MCRSARKSAAHRKAARSGSTQSRYSSSVSLRMSSRRAEIAGLGLVSARLRARACCEQRHGLEEVGAFETCKRRLTGEELLCLDPVVVEAEISSVRVEVLLVAGEGGGEQLEHVQ